MDRKLHFIFSIVAAIVSLSACSTRPPYERERQAGDASVSLVSTKIGAIVKFWIGTGDQLCQDFKSAGYVHDQAMDKMNPLVKAAAMLENVLNRKEEIKEIRLPIPVGKMIQIQAKAEASYYAGNTHIVEKCGPITSRFIPQIEQHYKVSFLWQSRSCRLILEDTSTPEAPLIIPFEPTNFCE
jgi:hypothetical protein